jgi:hypothetical protein
LNIIDFHLQKRARVHFIPDLKVGVFVTLRAPDVINPRTIRIDETSEEGLKIAKNSNV